VPSLTLGCGTFADNPTTGNVTYTNLLNIKRLARPIPRLQIPPVQGDQRQPVDRCGLSVCPPAARPSPTRPGPLWVRAELAPTMAILDISMASSVPLLLQ
jgi:hypothetical protein